MEFKVGDRVSVEGKVLEIGRYTIVVMLDGGPEIVVHPGFGFIKLIERPKKKVKKWKVVFTKTANPFPLVSVDYYKDEKEFMSLTSDCKFISIVKELEIEVEE